MKNILTSKKEKRNLGAALSAVSVFFAIGSILFSKGVHPRFGFIVSLQNGAVYLPVFEIMEIDLRYILLACSIGISIGIYYSLSKKQTTKNLHKPHLIE